MARDTAICAPPQRSSTKAKASSERVLDAAAKLFRERGYAATTIRDVAEEAEMQAGSLYYHYASKQDLLEAVLKRTMSELSAAVGPILRAREPHMSYRDRFWRALHAHLTVTTALGDYSLVSKNLVNELKEEVRMSHFETRRALDAEWRRLFVEAIASGEIRGDLDHSLVRLFVMGAVNSTNDWYRPDGKSIVELVDTLTSLVFEGLWPREALRIAESS